MTGTQMGADAALHALFAPLGMTNLALRAGGGAAQEAQEAGASSEDQLFYALANAGVEVLTEKMTDHGFYTGGMTDAEITDRALNLALRDVARELNISVPPDADTAALSNAVDQRIAQMRSETAASTQETAGDNARLTDADAEEYVKTGKTLHTRAQKGRMVESGKSPILTSVEAVKKFIRDCIHGNVKDEIRGYGKVGTALASAIREADTKINADKVNGSPLDVTGYYLELESRHLLHINDHIEEDADSRNTPLTEEEAERIPEYIDRATDILDVIRRKDGSVRVKIGSRINGYSIVIECVSKERNSLHPVTAWKMATEAYETRYKNRRTTPINTSRAQSNAQQVDIDRNRSSVGSIPASTQKVNTQTPTPAEAAFLDGLAGKEFNVLPPGLDYERWSKALGFYDTAKTVAEFNALRYTDSDRFALLQAYIADVESGKVSPDLGFAAYEQAAGRSLSGVLDTAGAEGYPEEHFDRKAHFYTYEEDLKATNPNYAPNTPYGNNCQRCVPAYALRRKGYSVEACSTGENQKTDLLLRSHPESIWEKGGSSVAIMSARGSAYFGKPEIEQFMKRLPDGAMCEIRCVWAKTGMGHVFVAEKINGKVHYIDPQTGNADVSWYFKYMKSDHTRFWRIDDADMDDSLIPYCCKNRGGK